MMPGRSSKDQDLKGIENHLRRFRLGDAPADGWQRIQREIRRSSASSRDSRSLFPVWRDWRVEALLVAALLLLVSVPTIQSGSADLPAAFTDSGLTIELRRELGSDAAMERYLDSRITASRAQVVYELSAASPGPFGF